MTKTGIATDEAAWGYGNGWPMSFEKLERTFEKAKRQ
jgi:hypothetical protein